MKRSMTGLDLEVLDAWHPLSVERWSDLEQLFGPRGAVGGCWCMDRRLPRSEFLAGRGDGNRNRLRVLAERDSPPGVIGYVSAEPIGWVAVGPRRDFPVIDRSIVARSLDRRADWVIACVFVAAGHRRVGVGRDLVRAACLHAAATGAADIEGFAVEPAAGQTPDPFAFYGVARQFAAVGFVEVARPTPTRPVMRRTL